MEDARQHWNVAEASDEGIGEAFENLPAATTSVYVNGQYIDITPGDPFGPTVMQAARDANIGKFRVFDGSTGREYLPEDPNTPESFEVGMKVEIRPYDEAA